jgi:dolichol-phosphate mannosyltransferase
LDQTIPPTSAEKGHDPGADIPARAGGDLTVIVPTFNEAGNVAPLVERLATALAGLNWRVIFVDDDSPDGTADVVNRIAASDRRVQCLRRLRRRGLAGAVVEGVMASASPFVAVIDADLQHDEALLPAMFEVLRAGNTDLVIGSRYLEPEGLASGLSPLRRAGSRLATWLARRVLKADVSDPVSGFFMIRRDVVERVAPRLSVEGFKILFDIIASQPTPLGIVEMPYAFRERQRGESKLDRRVIIEYLGLVLAKLTYNRVSVRALMFLLVGASGLVIHLAVLRMMIGLGLAFAVAQLVAAVTAMTSNFLINNAVTYRDRRLTGTALLIGYLRFCALCSIGLIANVAVADLVHRHAPIWWLAGISGALFGALWNYVSTSVAVW